MPSDDAFDLLESVADFLCSYDRDGTAVLIRAVAKEYERKSAEIERLRYEIKVLEDQIRAAESRDEAADAAGESDD